MVTGGNSFIGTHLVNELIRQNVNISVLVRRIATVPKEWIHRVKVFEGNIVNSNSILKIGNSNNFDSVFHLAAYVHQTPKTEEEKQYVKKVNVDGTKNLLLSLNQDVKHVILFSSVSVFGVDEGIALDETNITKPSTAYGMTKLQAELILKEWGKEMGIKTTSLRLPLVYGPGAKGNIYKMIEAIDNGRFVMIGKGHNKRSMVYVGNVVDAAIAVINRKVADKKVYIITDSVDYTAKELYKLISKGLCKKPLPFYVPMGIAKMLAIIGDVGSKMIRKPLPFESDVLMKLTRSLTFSSGKIQKEICFKPKYNLYNTIDETIKWYKGGEGRGRQAASKVTKMN